MFSLLSFIPQAMATANTPAPAAVVKGDFQSMKHTSSNRISKVVDAQTILMKDGKIIRLLGIDYPMMAGTEISPAMLASKDRIEKLLPEGTEVDLWQSFNAKTGRINRMGHILAHLALKKNQQWINGTLIAEGLAWTVTDASNPEMAEQMYALEQKSRNAKLGLWSDKLPFGVLPADKAAKGNGTFRIVQGKILKAATSKNNLYLNFGNDTKKDFTVMISAGLRKALSKRGIDPMALMGREVRVRGWIRDWNGPFMELETAERLELLSPAPPTDLSPDISTESPTDRSPPSETGQLNP